MLSPMGERLSSPSACRKYTRRARRAHLDLLLLEEPRGEGDDEKARAEQRAIANFAGLEGAPPQTSPHPRE
jgi:hypothetical protein